MSAQYTKIVYEIAEQLKFDYCGIAKAEPLYEDALRLENWLKSNYHGQMGYMANYFDLRIDPTKLVPGAKSVICLSLNYYHQHNYADDKPKISKYAFGQDYHNVIRKKLKEFLFLIKERIGDVHGRGFVDSAPVLERTWAQKSGLGWIGKNGMLINKKAGSFYFLATLIVDIPLEPTNFLNKDYCGTCTKCIDHCPTEAIMPNKVIDGSKCISYYTIELKTNEIDSNNNFNNWIFGCDICQDVCPWNRFSKQNTNPEFADTNRILDFSVEDWLSINQEKFDELFKNSPIKRSKLQGIQRNIRKFIKDKNS